MSDEVPQEFYELADDFVQLANTLVPEHGISRVSAVIMFAASRFNAHCAHELDPAVDDHRDAAISYLVEQYRQMLTDNFGRLARLRAAEH
jgi:hypothetical protein